MPATVQASLSFKAPEVSQADIESFHATHFSGDAIGLFESQFLQPHLAYSDHIDSYDYVEEGEDDDGLGYYSDGVKRTLTDEQIAIFRHSELEALRRAETNAVKLDKKGTDGPGTDTPSDGAVLAPVEKGVSPNLDVTDGDAEGSEDGEIETEKHVLTKAEARRQKKLRARQRRKDSQKFQPEKKPDLRKRTWDVVDAGMDGLYYDDLEMSQDRGSASTAQRKQISYDD
ncbi:hypothetical protein F5Y14DRAFT_444710 [Nemania sp. NC0429]|nr:hypothetical protein F5Y14DRAFT_444710 [Nemania sp. NC0429]